MAKTECVLPADEFKAAIQAVKGCLAHTDMVPLLAGISIAGREVAAYDVHVGCSVLLSVDTQMDCVVPGDRLVAAVKGMPGDEIKLVLAKDKLTVSAGRRRATIALLDVAGAGDEEGSGFPTIRCGMEEAVTLPEQFGEAVVALLGCLSKDQKLSLDFRSVFIQGDSLFGTDGLSVTWCRFKEPVLPDGQEMVIGREVFDVLTSKPIGSRMVSLWKEKNTVHVQCESGAHVVGSSFSDVEFPSCSDKFPEDEEGLSFVDLSEAGSLKDCVGQIAKMVSGLEERPRAELAFFGDRTAVKYKGPGVAVSDSAEGSVGIGGTDGFRFEANVPALSRALSIGERVAFVSGGAPTLLFVTEAAGFTFRHMIVANPVDGEAAASDE